MTTTLPKHCDAVINAFLDGVRDSLGANLYGVYMYGAAVFPDAGPIQDIDCHAILHNKLTDDDRTALRQLFSDIAERFAPLSEELDVYFILLKDARRTSPPQHQVNPEIFDDSWALHCAHIRPGYYKILLGPEPTEIFPSPSWPAIAAALDHELQYVKDHPNYPAYGVLNLCRIMYSYTHRNPAVSKQFSGRWASDHYPQWKPLIQDAMAYYQQEDCQERDDQRIRDQLNAFLQFAVERIGEARKAPIASDP